jgi:hypothetical protein
MRADSTRDDSNEHALANIASSKTQQLNRINMLPDDCLFYRPIAHDVTAPVHDDAFGGQISNLYMHNITFVNKANFVKIYNNFALKWSIFALYVVVVPEQILLGSIWRTL